MNGPPPPLVQELAALGYAFTHALYTEAKELLVKEGLSPRKAHLLGLLAKGVDLPSQLAELLEVHPSQVSHLLAALEEEGLVERSPDPQDRRKVKLFLTPKGREAAARAEALWLSVFGRRLARLSPEEQAAFLRILRKLMEVEDA